MRGKIITMSASRAFKLSDEQLGISSPRDAYLITFSRRLLPYAEERGWNYCPELAPSSFLFNQMQEFKKDPSFDKTKTFEEYYKPRYLNQLDDPFSFKYLEELATKVLSGTNILLVCFCGEDLTCHRSILKELLDSI